MSLHDDRPPSSHNTFIPANLGFTPIITIWARFRHFHLALRGGAVIVYFPSSGRTCRIPSLVSREFPIKDSTVDAILLLEYGVSVGTALMKGGKAKNRVLLMQAFDRAPVPLQSGPCSDSVRA